MPKEMGKLAIEGGVPVREEPFPPRIIFGEEEKQAILEVVEKTMNGDQALDRYGGIHVDTYEKEFAAYFGSRYATAVSSGTAAVHSALAALQLEPGSEVITSPITDPGTVSPILSQNLIPVFADVDYQTLNITAPNIKERITDKTGAIIVVHLAGQPCDMDPIMELAKENSLTVIEDCAQAHGSKYKGRYVGIIGDVGVFSLMSGKHMTSGGQGGMVITNNEEIYWNAKRFADRGKPFHSDEDTNLFMGLNYRMTELEAGVGRMQLKKLNKIIEKRQRLVNKLREGISQLKTVRLWKIIEGAEPNYWFCFLRYDNKDKETFAKAVQAEGIPVGAHYVKVMYEGVWIKERKAYGNSGYPWSCPRYGKKIDYTHCCPQAEKALEDHMLLYIHEGWAEKEVDDTIMALEKVESCLI